METEMEHKWQYEGQIIEEIKNNATGLVTADMMER